MRMLYLFALIIIVSSSCSIFKKGDGASVVKPKTHKVWARGNRYVIDIPVGNRHIRMIERKRTRRVRMN